MIVGKKIIFITVVRTVFDVGALVSSDVALVVFVFWLVFIISLTSYERKE